MKVVKLLLVVVVLLVALVVVGVLLAFRSIDSIAKRAIERGGTYATGVQTTVDSADVEVFAGTFAMSGLNIANPAGYSSPHFLNMGDASVAVSLATLRQPTITMPHLTLSDIDVYLDKSGGAANYKVILDNLKKLESGEKPPSSEPGGGRKIIIDTLTISGTTVHLASVPGLSQALGDVKVQVPTIEMTGVGSKDGGMTTAELVKLIVQTVLTATVEAGGGLIPADLLGDLRGQLSQLASLDQLGVNITGGLGSLGTQLQEQVGERAQQELEKVTGGAQEQVEEAAKEATDKLKGIFGGKKDD